MNKASVGDTITVKFVVADIAGGCYFGRTSRYPEFGVAPEHLIVDVQPRELTIGDRVRLNHSSRKGRIIALHDVHAWILCDDNIDVICRVEDLKRID